MQPDRFNNGKYGNWVKTSLSLLYLKEGVTNFSDEKAGEFHKDVVDSVRLKSTRAVTTTCTTCTHKNAIKTKAKDKTKTTWRMNCSCNVCSVWLEEILPYHLHLPLPNIAWANSNPQLWPSDVWELAKLFQPYGCANHKNAGDSDCTSLLSMMLDCRFFSKFLTNTALLQEIKDVRNACMHSKDQEIDDQDMKNALDVMVALLEEPSLKNRQECISAKTKIMELRDNALELRLNKDLEIRALNNRVAEVRTDMDRLAAEHQQVKTDMNDITDRQDSTVEEYNQLRDRMTQVRQEITEMTENWKSIQQTLDPSLGGKVDDLTSRLTDLETKSQADYEDVLENVKSTMAIFEGRLQEIETQKVDEKQQNEDILKRAKKDLIYLYNTHRQTVPIFPIRPEWRQNVTDMYVKPSMVDVSPPRERISTDQTCRKNKDATLENIRDIFYSGEESYKDVYLIAEGGAGKSTMCELLVYLWAKEHSEMESEAGTSGEGEASFMKNFELLFYISLREAERMLKWDIEDIITSQFSYLNLKKEDISKLLLDNSCLIILDGLDEYSQKHPHCTEYVNANIPWRCRNDKCTILTTSRPWKMETLANEQGLKIDRQIRINGLETESQKHLAEKVILKLNSIKEGQNKDYNDFIKDMKKGQLENNMKTPTLLLQMLGLWFDGESFGKSQCEIYSKIIEKQFQFAAEVNRVPTVSNKEDSHSYQSTPQKSGSLPKLSKFAQRHLSCKHHAEEYSEEESSDAQLPICFSGQRYCQAYKELLLKVSKFAYHQLFGKQESALVFDHDQMEIMGLSENEIHSCLDLGMLTQYNVLGKIMQKQKSFSFVHKTHQEFFAAIYLWKTASGSNLKKRLADFTNLDRVLQVEKVFMFVSGMNPDVSREIAKVIMDQASEDSRVQQYRRSCRRFTAPSEAFVQQIQGVILAAIEESKGNGETMHSIILQDIWMQGEHKEFPPSRILACIHSLRLTHVRSIYIEKPPDISRDAIWNLVNNDLPQLNNIVLCNWYISASRVRTILRKHRDSLKALCLHYQNELYLCHLAQRYFKMILSPNALALNNIRLSHKQLEFLHKHLGRRSYTEVILSDLRCQRHDVGCKPNLDLSASTELQCLLLIRLPIACVVFVPDNLLKFEIGKLPDTVAAHAFRILTAASSLETLGCDSVKETALVELMGILPQLTTLKYVSLSGIDMIDQQQIVLQNTNSLSMISLYRVTLTATQLRQFLDSLPSHDVSVYMGFDTLYAPVIITDYDSKNNIIEQTAASPKTEVVRKAKVMYDDDKCIVKVFQFYHRN